MIKYLRNLDSEDPVDSPLPVVILDEEIDALPFDRIACPDLKAIAEVWLDLPRADGDMLPRWSSFSPAMVKRHLDKVCVLQVGDIENHEIEFTVYGNHPTELIGNGKPVKMQDMRESRSEQRNYADIRQRTGRSITNKAPQFARKARSLEGSGEIEYELILLPFETENGTTRLLQPLSSTERRLSA